MDSKNKPNVGANIVRPNECNSTSATGEQCSPLQSEHTCPAAAATCRPHEVLAVKAVCISEQKGTTKTPVHEIHIKKDYGIVGDAHAGGDHRQVSLLADESVETLRNRIPNLEPGVFAENILTSGIRLHKLPVGTILQIGDVQLKVTQIGKACHNDGCAIKKQTGDCVMPREGIFASALTNGIIKPGDEISINTNQYKEKSI